MKAFGLDLSHQTQKFNSPFNFSLTFHILKHSTSNTFDISVLLKLNSVKPGSLTNYTRYITAVMWDALGRVGIYVDGVTLDTIQQQGWTLSAFQLHLRHHTVEMHVVQQSYRTK